MITGDQIGLTVRFYVTGKGCGWKTGRLLALEKQKKRFIAVIEPPIAGQRKRRVPAEDCEIYQEEK